jgi:hypothetical protein
VFGYIRTTHLQNGSDRCYGMYSLFGAVLSVQTKFSTWHWRDSVCVSRTQLNGWKERSDKCVIHMWRWWKENDESCR